MNRSTLVAAGAAILLSPAAALAAYGTADAGQHGPAVNVRVTTGHKTLLDAADVHAGSGWITKGGTPRGKCPAASAAGALNKATKGHWTGKYYASVQGIFITSILGHKPPVHTYWGVYVHGQLASKGICQLKLQQGERLLFKITK